MFPTNSDVPYLDGHERVACHSTSGSYFTRTARHIDLPANSGFCGQTIEHIFSGMSCDCLAAELAAPGRALRSRTTAFRYAQALTLQALSTGSIISVHIKDGKDTSRDWWC